jgi:hypothetical protein
MMTNLEIDKWVEEHVKYPENSTIAPYVIKWGKNIAYKFYNQGKDDMIALLVSTAVIGAIREILKNYEA